MDTLPVPAIATWYGQSILWSRRWEQRNGYEKDETINKGYDPDGEKNSPSPVSSVKPYLINYLNANIAKNLENYNKNLKLMTYSL